jgi:diaminopimelate epimerase
MDIPFIKMHGLGNNYIYVDLFRTKLEESLLPRIARKVSNVHTGLGSDGLILIQPSEKADIGMRIFNRDGSEGNTCGNGLRCTAKYAYENGIVSAETFKVETKANIVEAVVTVKNDKVSRVTINMGKPILRRPNIPMMGDDDPYVINETFIISNKELKLTAVSMGNPHAIFFAGDIENAGLKDLGSAIEKDLRFPEGVNTGFVEIISDTEMHFRIWERGSGITHACGTGACAAVVAASLNGYVQQDQPIVVHLQGGNLTVKWNEQGDVLMTGDAHTIAAGTYFFHFSTKGLNE